MKLLIKILLSILLLLLSGCSRTSNPIDLPTSPIPTIDETNSENIQSNKQLAPPYINSILNKLDFSKFNDEKLSSKCSGDITESQCIELYGIQSAMPEGLSLIDDGEKNDGFHHFELINSIDNSTIKFAIVNEIYDSTIFDYYFLIQDGKTDFGIFFFYDDNTLNNHPERYDVKYVLDNSGGPLFFHTAYYITQNQELLANKEVIGIQNDYTLAKKQYFYLFNDSPEEAIDGCKYLENLEMVKLVD